MLFTVRSRLIQWFNLFYNFLKVHDMKYVLYILLCWLSACSFVQPSDDLCTASDIPLSYTVLCYKKQVESQPLDSTLVETKKSDGITKKTYDLVSQSFSPLQLVDPAIWRHQVTFYIPDNALSARAVLIVNNGIPYPKPGDEARGATDFLPDELERLAQSTQTVIISLDNVPNQYLTYRDINQPLLEDYSVAHSWRLFMQDPLRLATLPIHVPMAASISRALTLAERELKDWGIHRFIVSGASKRAWATWLATLVDSRIEAIVPFVLDLLNTQQGLKHIYRSYGNNWPIAIKPYYKEGIVDEIDTPAFEALMEIEDPLTYLDIPFYRTRLEIPKYIINASGDDFFVPDNAQYYMNQLPGKNTLRMVPNASHYSVRRVAERSLSTFINRLQRQLPMPELVAKQTIETNHVKISLRLSEPPTQLILWQANNPLARDFRYACGIVYTQTVLNNNAIDVTLNMPKTGWSAYFIEATFLDGFTLTTPAVIMGQQDYPTGAPPSGGPACQTLVGRGR